MTDSKIRTFVILSKWFTFADKIIQIRMSDFSSDDEISPTQWDVSVEIAEATWWYSVSIFYVKIYYFVFRSALVIDRPRRRSVSCSWCPS